MAHDLGDTVGLSITVRDAAGAPANAASVALTITLPDQTTASPPITNPPAETGIYVYDYVATQAGRHVVRWVTTTPATAFVDVFDVRPAAPAYLVSLTDMKRHLRITSATEDETLRGFIEAATEVIERHLNEAVVMRTFTEVHVGGSTVVLNHTPVVSLTTLTPVYSGGVSYLPADLDLNPVTGVVQQKSAAGLYGPLRIAYIAGRSSIPANYVLAAKIIVQHLWQTRRGAAVGSAAGVDLEGESEFLTGLGFSVPHRAIELLGSGGIPGIA